MPAGERPSLVRRFRRPVGSISPIVQQQHCDMGLVKRVSPFPNLECRTHLGHKPTLEERSELCVAVGFRFEPFRYGRSVIESHLIATHIDTLRIDA